MKYWLSKLISHPKWMPENYERAPGDFYDPNSYIGNVHYIMTGLVVIFLGLYGEYFILYLHLIFGFEYSIPSPGKIQWYGRVAFFLGSSMCVIGILNFCKFHRRRKMRLNLYPSEEKMDMTGNFFQRFPLFRDLVLGWPFVMALILIFHAHPVDAILGVFLGWVAHEFNYVIYKKKILTIPVHMAISFSINSVAVLLWWKMSVAANGYPDGWQDIPMLPLF